MAASATAAHGAGSVPPAWQTLLADFAALAGEWQQATRGGGPAALAAATQLADRAATLWARAATGGASTALGDIAGLQANGVPLAAAADLAAAIGRLQLAAIELAGRDRQLLSEGAAAYAARLAADGHAPRSAHDLLALWIDIQDDVRGRAMAGSDYVARHAELVNAAVAVVAALQATLGGIGAVLALAPRAEVDALAARITALEANAAGSLVPQPAPRRAARSMQAARPAARAKAAPPVPAKAAKAPKAAKALKAAKSRRRRPAQRP